MFSNCLVKIVYLIQLFLTKSSYFFFNLSKKEKSGNVVGLEEVASMLHHMNSALPNTVSVNILNNHFYEFKYDYELSRLGPMKFIVLPILLGKLAASYKTFIYMGAAGFLSGRFDGRAGEFKFLKSVDCKVVCYFTGSEIRSFKLLNEYALKNKLDVVTTYQPFSHKNIDTEQNELKRKQLACAASVYADLIFNPSTDQMSYIKKETQPSLYFYPDDNFKICDEKWEDVERLVIVHCPSSPLIKGTPLVRAAIKQLQEEGYDFEYIELIGVPNSEVIATLKRAHIVLNEFYAFVPGVFGVEAMASNSVLITSADIYREPTLFPGANSAWVVTPYWSIYNNLKEQVNTPILKLKQQADAGTYWAKSYCSYSFSSSFLRQRINELND